MLRLQGVTLKSEQSATEPLPPCAEKEVQEMETETMTTDSVEQSIQNTSSEMEVEEPNFCDLQKKSSEDHVEETKKSIDIVPILFDPSSQAKVK